jgi:hypothetical protein
LLSKKRLIVWISVCRVCRAKFAPTASACPGVDIGRLVCPVFCSRRAPSRSRRACGLFFPRGLSSTHFLLRLGNASKPPLSLRPKHQLLETGPVTVCFVFGERDPNFFLSIVNHHIPVICHEQACRHIRLPQYFPRGCVPTTPLEINAGPPD